MSGQEYTVPVDDPRGREARHQEGRTAVYRHDTLAQKWYQELEVGSNGREAEEQCSDSHQPCSKILDLDDRGM